MFYEKNDVFSRFRKNLNDILLFMRKAYMKRYLMKFHFQKFSFKKLLDIDNYCKFIFNLKKHSRENII